jgi:Rho termination factor, N-terminal domain
MIEEEIRKAEGQETEQGQPDQPEKPLEKMTAPELREIAIKLPGVTGVHAMKKDELLAIIKEARGIKDEAPSKRRARKKAKGPVTVGEVKKKISQLMLEKQAARESRDMKRVEILRRRINRMKKLSRKVKKA